MEAKKAINERLKLPKTSITSKIIDRKFGRPEDYIETHIYNENDQFLTSIENFTDYNKPENLSTELNMDPVTLLNNNGYNTGRYKLVFNILRKKIFNTSSKKFILKAISSSRTELRIIAKEISNAELKRASQRFINEISNSPFLRDFILNLGYCDLPMYLCHNLGEICATANTIYSIVSACKAKCSPTLIASALT